MKNTDVAAGWWLEHETEIDVDEHIASVSLFERLRCWHRGQEAQKGQEGKRAWINDYRHHIIPPAVPAGPFPTATQALLARAKPTFRSWLVSLFEFLKKIK